MDEDPSIAEGRAKKKNVMGNLSGLGTHQCLSIPNYAQLFPKYLTYLIRAQVMHCFDAQLKLVPTGKKNPD